MARASKGGSGGARQGRGGGGAGGAASASAGSIRAGAAFVELFTKDDRLQKGLKSASATLKAWGAKMAAAGGVLIGAGSAIAAPLAGLLKSAVGRAEHIGDVSDVFGLTAESASKMASAFELAGGSIEELEMALGKLALANSEGKPLDEFFKEQAKAISEIDDATERYQAAAGIFGNKFARTFVDNAGDVLELLDKAPSLTQTALAQAKAFRMEWTRIGIVLQDGMLPVLRVLNPISLRVSEFAKQNVGLLPTIAAVSVGVIGAGAALVGFGATLSAAGVVVGALGTGVGMLLSPFGLVASGLVAGGAAWVAYSNTAAGSLVTLGGAAKDTLAGIAEAVAAGDIEGAMEILTAGLNVVWTTGVNGLKEEWRGFTDFLGKTLGIEMKSVEAAWLQTTTEIAKGMADIAGRGKGEKSRLAHFLDATIPISNLTGFGDKLDKALGLEGLKPEGLKDIITQDNERAQRELMNRNANADRAEEAKRLAAAQAELARLRGKNRGVDFGFDLNPALAAAGMGASGSSRGAFNFANASQFFGGNSLEEKQLKQAEKIEAAVMKVVDAIIKMPPGRIT